MAGTYDRRNTYVHRAGQPERGWLSKALFGALLLAGGAVAHAQDSTNQVLFSEAPSLWKAGIGEGLRKGAHEVNLSGGAGFGMKVLGTRETHNWVIGTLQFGWILSDVVGEGHWYQGNWELVAEVLGGEQYHPSHAYFVGGAPLLRYNLATGTRWVPFADLGAGLTATDIRDGDLSTTFEFNLQLGLGVRYFVSDKVALSAQYRFIHFSNAGIDTPNTGVNNSTILLGASWWF